MAIRVSWQSFGVVSIGAASAAVVLFLLDLWLTMPFLPVLPFGLAFVVTFAVVAAHNVLGKRWDDSEALQGSWIRRSGGAVRPRNPDGDLSRVSVARAV